MRGLLADADVEGQLSALAAIFRSPLWSEVWDQTGLSIQTFETLSQLRTIPDSHLWRVCQQNQLVLVTGNRNQKGEDSLEAVLRRENSPDSLPVFTLANAGRIPKDRPYAERVAERLLEYLLDIDQYRGVGRMYLP